MKLELPPHCLELLSLSIVVSVLLSHVLMNVIEQQAIDSILNSGEINAEKSAERKCK